MGCCRLVEGALRLVKLKKQKEQGRFSFKCEKTSVSYIQKQYFRIRDDFVFAPQAPKKNFSTSYRLVGRYMSDPVITPVYLFGTVVGKKWKIAPNICKKKIKKWKNVVNSGRASCVKKMRKKVCMSSSARID